jgi:hypothetical protein
MRWRFIAAFVLSGVTLGGARGAAQARDDAIDLVVKSGRPLRVALEQRITVKRIGQPVTGVLAEAVYAHDRIVFPAGARVLGHIEAFEAAPRTTRVRSMLGGSFSTLRRVIVRFDAVVMDDGREIPIETVVTGNPTRMRRQVAGGTKKTAEEKPGVMARVRDEIAQRKDDAIAAIKEPGKLDRLKEMAIDRLPYHPQFLGKGTVYNAELVSPVARGTVTPVAVAAAGTLPAPGSILDARLVTPLDSAKTPRGTPIEAIVTQPVFSIDHQLILAEGTILKGEVTFAKTARRFRRNGQLRFLFESIQPPAQTSRALLASLYSVEAGADDHLAVDDEGGAKITNPKSRFIPPALALLALHANSDPEQRRFDNDADDTQKVISGNAGTRGVGGFFGWGLIGTAVSQISARAAIVVGAIGVARTVYSSVFAKGQEVSFPADTPIQVQLAPGSSPAPSK